MDLSVGIKTGLALHTLQWLMCHKIKPNQSNLQLIGTIFVVVYILLESRLNKSINLFYKSKYSNKSELMINSLS